MSFLTQTASATLLQPIIPSRFVRLGVQEQPANHCGLQQVKDELFGVNLDEFADKDGTFTTLDRITSGIIEEVSAQVVLRLNTPYDWCRHVHFVDGPGTPRIVLPFKNIAYVNVCFLRVLPSLPWYRFVRFRNVDGTEFARIGGIEPPQAKPENLPPNLITAEGMVSTVQYTGIEDSDLMVDTQRRMIAIPPRVLIAGVQFPIWTYTFLPAMYNVETHFVFGFAPTKYENGKPLAYDNASGYVLPRDPSVQNQNDPMGNIDWSSGMPRGLTQGVARLVVNRLLRRKWRALSNGLASSSVDGASESYGGTAFGGDLQKEDEIILNELTAKYGMPMLV